MSTQFGKLCSLILLEHFGEIVQKVGDDLFKWGSRPLRLITASTRLPSPKVKQALRILIQYGFVVFNAGQSPEVAEYKLSAEKVLLLLRYPKYLLLIKTKYGDEAELIIEELLRIGQDIASNVILKAVKRFKECKKGEDTSLVKMRDKFSLMVTKQYLMRCPSAVAEENIPTLTVKERELHLPPELNMKILSEVGKGSSEPIGDENIYWRVNYDRFHQDFRDEIMISAIKRRLDDDGAELMRIMLQQMYLRTEAWVASSNPIPYTEIKEVIRKENTHPNLLQYFDQYLKVLEEDSSNFIVKVGDSGGGQYSVTIKDAFKQLNWTIVENIALEKFGSKAARIFRLIKSKKYIEQEQIQQFAMISDKEAKLLTYNLLEENFIQMQELRKSLASNGPNKTFFLFHIDLNQVTRMILELSYKTLYNILTRRDFEKIEHKRLIEKQQRIDSIVLNMREQGATEEQLAQIEEMITAPEQTLLEKVRTTINKLTEAEFHLDETIFILQLNLMYS